MTAGINTGDGTCCYRCSHRTRPGDRYCERCGFALAVVPAAGQSTSEETVPVRPVPIEPLPGNGQLYSRNGHSPAGPEPVGATSAQDGTTRYLCAAAHLDEEFCDKAIEEFLVEPVRAIPPSPGVDSAAVLREAVAAQTRRRIRDALLLALLLVFACTNLIIAISWTIVVVIAAALQALGHGLTRRTSSGQVWLRAIYPGRTRRKLAAWVLLASPLVLRFSFSTSLLENLSGLLLLLDVLLIIGLLLVLVTDEIHRRQAYRQQLPAG